MTKLPYWKFILATILSTPRLLIPIFIGHNISNLSNPSATGKDKVIKWVVNVISIIIALVVAWYVYKVTDRRIQRVNAGLPAEINGGEEGEEMVADIEEEGEEERFMPSNVIVNMEDQEIHSRLSTSK
jgi:flagellar biosynthesis/type III secretory pathway M-ring protein FliF/YscJ